MTEFEVVGKREAELDNIYHQGFIAGLDGQEPWEMPKEYATDPLQEQNWEEGWHVGYRMQPHPHINYETPEGEDPIMDEGSQDFKAQIPLSLPRYNRKTEYEKYLRWAEGWIREQIKQKKVQDGKS